MAGGYISVRNWRRFQHYDPAKRQPPWIKFYVELMADDEFLGLSGYDRGVLCCLWLEYASSRCRLRADTRSLTRQLHVRVTSATLERLNHAGFIDIVASAVLAEGYQSASTSRAREEVEVEEETEKTAYGVNEASYADNGLGPIPPVYTETDIPF